MKTFQIPGHKKEVVNSNEVLYIIAAGRTCYLIVITDLLKKQWRKICSTHNLGHYKTLLEDTTLFNAHHRYIINLELVESFTGNYEVTMKIPTGEKLQVATRRFKNFKKELALVRGLQK